MTRLAILCCLALLTTLGCRSDLYYNTMETFGVHKRDMLVDRVEEARDDQQTAKEEFKTAYEKFTDVVRVEGGELEKTYNELAAAYDRSDDAAERVRERIQSIEEVAEDLFEEWERELDEYHSSELQRASRKTLDDTRIQYRRMISAMRDAAVKMDPVLVALKDQVLFLKHNLNARAIASLDGVSTELRKDVYALIAEMEKSIDEAEMFIAQMGK